MGSWRRCWRDQRPSEDGYTQETKVKLGQKIELPEPFNVPFDTGTLR